MSNYLKNGQLDNEKTAKSKSKTNLLSHIVHKKSRAGSQKLLGQRYTM